MCEMSGVCVWGFAVDFCDGGQFVPFYKSHTMLRGVRGACDLRAPAIFDHMVVQIEVASLGCAACL